MNIFQKFLRIVDGHEKTDFLLNWLFWLRPLFWSVTFKKILHVVDEHEKTDFFTLMTVFAPAIFSIHEILKNDQKMTRSVKFIKVKKQLFMPVNHTNEFLKSVHTQALFSDLFSWNFEQLFPSCETFFQKFFGSNHYKWLEA